jgi:peptide/nickel transport system permease protein
VTITTRPVHSGQSIASNPGPTIKARSPGRIALGRLRRDRSVLFSGSLLVLFVVLGVGAPWWSALYREDPWTVHFDLLTSFNSLPLGVNGGMSATHWLGVEPMDGRDILAQLMYGLRTSLGIALVTALATTFVGLLVGIVSGYSSGWLRAVVDWLTDVALAFPTLTFALAAVPVFVDRFDGDEPEQPVAFRLLLVISLLTIFGWPFTARVVRGQVLSLQEREFVDAARAAGAGHGHVLFRQLLPNLWAPILTVLSFTVPSVITAEASLSFLGFGITEPTPDLGRMVLLSLDYVQSDPWYGIIPGITILLLVLAFNLFGDSVRDALNPKR